MRHKDCRCTGDTGNTECIPGAINTNNTINTRNTYITISTRDTNIIKRAKCTGNVSCVTCMSYQMHRKHHMCRIHQRH